MFALALRDVFNLDIAPLLFEVYMKKQKEAGNLKSYVFRVVVEEDSHEGGEKAYHASCPALKGCHTWGHTSQEALANIREAVELYVEDLRAAGDPIPVDPERGSLELATPAVAVNV
jgi:predicted RNase H-like HicB family nuclease